MRDSAGALRAEVREHHGRPHLFLNGRPHDGCLFWHSAPLESREDLQRFAHAGVRLFTTGFPARRTEDGAWDLTGVERVMDVVLDAVPDLLVLPRISLEPPAWWHEAHPGELQVHVDAANGDRIEKMISFASARWRADMAAWLPDLIEACERRWGAHLLGYHLCAGACGEWSYYWGPVLSGYSNAQQQGFRAWLRTRYADDAALRKAWGTDASLDAATVPHDRVLDRAAWPRVWSVFDPRRDQAVLDYLTFHSETVAEAIRDFAACTRRTLDALGRRKLCGVFYGYHMVNAGIPYVLHNAGHQALDRVLTSPDVDFVAAPMNYNERHAGGMYHSKLPTASVAAHGTLYYDEDDTFTHLAKETPWRPRCRDAAETADVLWRNFAGTLQDRGAYWWMDHDGDGWYRDDAVMAEVARMRSLADARLVSDGRSLAQVAVITSAASARYLRYDPALMDALLPLAMSEYVAMGLPIDYVEVRDVARVFGAQDAGRYRMVIVADVLFADAATRRDIRAHVRGGDRTVVWIYGAGMIDEHDIDAEHVTDLTGVRVRLHDHGVPLRSETTVTGTRVTYGSCENIAPELVGDDPAAEVLGWTLYRGEPSLLRRRFDDWTSVWSASPMVPASVLRHLAREADVHVYADGGDRVWAAPGLLCLHAAHDGPRTVALPEAMDVVDVRSARELARGVQALDVTLRRGETLVWQCTPSNQEASA